ncbi:ATP/GTP-binding protein [Williamsia sp. SKLECPSW1]
MPRRNRRPPAGPRGVSGGTTRTESGPAGLDRDHSVRPISADRAVKPYLCPGCNQTIVPGTAHVVAWPADDRSGDERRHWHTGCWRGRRTRTGFR